MRSLLLLGNIPKVLNALKLLEPQWSQEATHRAQSRIQYFWDPGSPKSGTKVKFSWGRVQEGLPHPSMLLGPFQSVCSPLHDGPVGQADTVLPQYIGHRQGDSDPL